MNVIAAKASETGVIAEKKVLSEDKALLGIHDDTDGGSWFDGLLHGGEASRLARTASASQATRGNCGTY